MEITIIGLGGIGSILSNTISRYINTRDNITQPIINLVDGDKYEFKNTKRQEFNGFGNKAEIKCAELKDKFTSINFVDHSVFVDENTISSIINENTIVFVGVDNHRTRLIISEYAENLKDIVIISGGNELTDGNVQVFIKKDGVNITPSLTDYHPEIENATDKLPNEMSCEELSNSKPQLYFTNFMVASYMCAAFYNIIENNNYNFSEIYFDLLTMNANCKKRVPKTKNNTRRF